MARRAGRHSRADPCADHHAGHILPGACDRCHRSFEVGCTRRRTTSAEGRRTTAPPGEGAAALHRNPHAPHVPGTDQLRRVSADDARVWIRLVQRV